MAKVYAKLNDKKEVVEINSSVFIKDVKDYVLIDEGEGDKFAHAQGNYLKKDLTDEEGRYNFKYYRNKIVELKEEEKNTIEKEPTEIEKLNNRVTELENKIKKLCGEV